MTMRRPLLIAAGGLALCVALALVGGWPDPGRSFDLLTGRSVTAATESAFVTSLCWLAAMLLVVTVARALRKRRRRTAPPRIGSLTVVVIGLVLLGAGIARQGGYRVCCATPTTAQQAEQLVR
jgi:putative copper export protein